MKVGLVGLGKLGLPVAVTFGQKHTVYGYDLNPNLMGKRIYEHRELGPDGKDDFQNHFQNADIKFAPLHEMAQECEVIFVAVQTPHQPMYEGTTPIPEIRADFDYRHLVNAVRDVVRFIKPHHIVVVISTVLPGTMRREIIPILDGRAQFVYNPLFIAMGTVMRDALNPEFVLLGGDNIEARSKVQDFYKSVCGDDVQIQGMSVESAELTKVAYNTFIGMKIAYVNTLMEICHKISGCNVDSVIGAIKKSTDRLISTKYLMPGMGDGGGCHPRDNIAMSWLAQKLDLSHDFFTDVMMARQDQAHWLANLLIEHKGKELPIVILGKSFKPETNITTGSPSLLVSNLLDGQPHKIWDPYVDKGCEFDFGPSVFLIGTKHEQFTRLKFPEGSVVIDPHRYIPKQIGVDVIHLGNQ